MKKLLLLLVIPFALSCSKEDEPEEIQLTKSDLLGVWEIESSVYNGSETVIDECDANEQIEFTEDEFIVTGAFWWDQFMEENCHVYTEDYRYKFENNRIEIEYEGGGVFYYGRVLDENTIEIKTNIDESTTIDTYKRA